MEENGFGFNLMNYGACGLSYKSTKGKRGRGVY